MSAPSEAAADRRTIVITGASSGIGLDAAKKLVDMGHKVYLACRTEAKAKEAKAATGAAWASACDLSSLDSVRNFAKTWGSTPIDSLCLNAGVAPSTKGSARYTAEGFEMAFGTNHLGHFLLANLLQKNLESSELPRSRLVVTASSVHDPDTPGGDVGSKATLGELAGLERWCRGGGQFDMVDGEVYDGDKAYKDSKLCNVLFTREAERRLTAASSKVTANCFSPGLITSTGLFRNQDPAFVKAFDFAATNILKVAASVSKGGDTLTYMAQSPDVEKVAGGAFWATPPGKPTSPFAVRDVSVEARDGAKARRLWELSAQATGLKMPTAI